MKIQHIFMQILCEVSLQFDFYVEIIVSSFLGFSERLKYTQVTMTYAMNNLLALAALYANKSQISKIIDTIHLQTHSAVAFTQR